MPFPNSIYRHPLLLAAVLLAPAIGSGQTGQIPTFQVIVPESKIDFHVDASVALTGVFAKWAAGLHFTTPYVQSGVLELIVQAASVKAGSSLKEGKLKGNDFFAVKENPEITFRSKKIVLTGTDAYRVDGDFTIRGLTKEESLTLNYSPDRPDEGRIRGRMVFDRRQYGMTHGIPLIKIADRVEVGVDLKIRRLSGPRPIQKKE
ncbi:MAG: YceI family protein [Bryobacterales bacterium]|nr:YceI family protein [Bryobacterales bacterium]